MLIVLIVFMVMCGVIYITLRLTLNRPIIISKEVWEESAKRPITISDMKIEPNCAGKCGVKFITK